MLLRLNQESLEEAKSILKNSKKFPRFLKSLDAVERKALNRDMPFDLCFRYLQSMVDDKSPFHKAYFMMTAIEQIPKQIDVFYASNGLETQFELEDEEIASILMLLLSKSLAAEELSTIVLLVSLFLTDSMKKGTVGICFNQFLRVHERIAFNATS